MKKKLKLYVWTDVFCDYTSGIAFALATSPDHARKLIARNYMPASQKTAKDRAYWRRIVNKELVSEPQVVTRAAGFQQSGGG